MVKLDASSSDDLKWHNVIKLIKGRAHVLVTCTPQTMERAEEIRAEFEADWKGSVRKYNVDVEVG